MQARIGPCFVSPIRHGRGLTLTELCVVTAVIVVLMAFLLPAIRSAREQASRAKCASNLRQIGQLELVYCTENNGWLLLRSSAHPATASHLAAPQQKLMAVELGKWAPGGQWFCPNARQAGGELLSDSERASLLKVHRIGYSMYSAWWDGKSTRPMAEPCWGPVSRFVNARARRITELRSNTVRASEWFEPTVAMGGTGGKKANLPNHADDRGRFAGGNLLYGDGSVRWSSYGFQYHAADLYVYVMPDEGHQARP